MTTLFTGAQVFDGSQWLDRLQIAGPKVTMPGPEAPVSQNVALPGGWLLPGFVDLQVNGGDGVLFNHAPTVQTLARMAQAHLGLGVTRLLPTLITDTPDVTRAAIDAVAAACRDGVPGIAGLHLEGPHLAQPKAGAHDPTLIRPMAQADLDLLREAATRLPALMVTVAPETVTPAQIAQLVQAGIVVSLGHSACSYEQAVAAAQAGARCVTHLFNAMSPLDSRSPGLVGAALNSGGLNAGLIADFIHIHPETIRAALAAKQGPGQVFLVSDAMAVAGSPAQSFTLNGRCVSRRDGHLTLPDGTLAGADLDLTTALRNLVHGLGLPMAQVAPMLGAVPADLMGLRAGYLRPGDPADMVWLDDSLTLRRVWQGGVEMPVPGFGRQD
jgi:N-acetylglucosamine-6-phosphate deacetylase